MESWIADKELSDGTVVTIARIEDGIYKGSMLTIKSSGVSKRFLPNILKQKNTTAGKIFRELNNDTDTFDSACDKIDSL
jgi:hypothetical protein